MCCSEACLAGALPWLPSGCRTRDDELPQVVDLDEGGPALSLRECARDA
jgi:hypothetical protein